MIIKKKLIEIFLSAGFVDAKKPHCEGGCSTTALHGYQRPENVHGVTLIRHVFCVPFYSSPLKEDGEKTKQRCQPEAFVCPGKKHISSPGPTDTQHTLRNGQNVHGILPPAGSLFKRTCNGVIQPRGEKSEVLTFLALPCNVKTQFCSYPAFHYFLSMDPFLSLLHCLPPGSFTPPVFSPFAQITSLFGEDL